MTESAQVVFKPITGTDGLAYHETLIYTDSSGHKYAISGGHSSTTLPKGLAYDLGIFSHWGAAIALPHMRAI